MASYLGVVDTVSYVKQQISVSKEEFYRQMPFEVVEDANSHVVDFRYGVTEQLRQFVLSGKADKGWVSL